jgi:Mce-associated membrane protein
MSTAEETARTEAVEGDEAAEAPVAAGPAEAAGTTAPTGTAGSDPQAAQDGVQPREDGADPADGGAGAPGEGAPGEGAPGREAERGAATGRLQRIAGWPKRRLAAVAVLLVALLLSGGLLYAAAQLRDPAAGGNHALTDTAATDQVAGEISSALTRIFAYTPQDTRSTAQAARDVLDGTAATQYQALFGQIRQQVASQQLTLTTRVVRAGVVSLTASRARLLVFLDQSAQRAGGAATSAAAQLSVTAEFKGGHWRITRLTAR